MMYLHIVHHILLQFIINKCVTRSINKTADNCGSYMSKIVDIM